LRSIRPEDGGIDSEEKTVAVDDTSLADALKVSDVLEAADTSSSGPEDTTGDAGGTTPRPN
jgi:hypothetical protein